MLLRCFQPDDCAKEFFSWRSKPPRDRKQFEEASEFILGHFTSSVFFESIVSKGLLPDVNQERAKDDNLPSDSVSVYLASTFDSFYSQRATRHHGGKGLIVEVQVPRLKLAADENIFGKGEMEKLDPLEALYISMCGGACKHSGVIALDSILTIRDVDGVVHYEKLQ